MNKVLSDFVNNPVLFFTAFILILIGVVVILFSMYYNKKHDTQNLIKNVNEEFPNLDETKSSDINIGNNSIDIESMLREMQNDLDKKKDDIETFEDEQEEKSIISYQELVNAAKKNKNIDEQIEYETDSEVQKFVDQIKGNSIKSHTEIEETETKKETPSNEKKFQGSEFISPIYGRVSAPEYIEKPNTPIIRATKKQKEIETLDIDFDDFNPRHASDIIEKSFNMDALDQEVLHNDEFLNALKEFRKNLE
ncbi:MAG: hypothetical protein IJ134_02180 [Bacilli bacterium]|nr:hypothetical protein [Bacilli bacterium]